MSEWSVRPYLIVVSPRMSEVSRSPSLLSSVQSASPVSTCQCPAGTVQALVAFPGLGADRLLVRRRSACRCIAGMLRKNAFASPWGLFADAPEHRRVN